MQSKLKQNVKYLNVVRGKVACSWHHDFHIALPNPQQTHLYLAGTLGGRDIVALISSSTDSQLRLLQRIQHTASHSEAS